MELSEELLEQYQTRYDAAIKEGQTIEVNEDLPYVDIEHNEDQTYFFQGEGAEDLLKTVPENIWPEVYLLAVSQEW